MTTEHFTYLLAHPEKLIAEDASDLEMILQKYPYFQSARALQLKILKNENSYRYNEALKSAAAHTTDRDILFEYITSDQFIQNEISQNILLNYEETDPEIDPDSIEVAFENVSQTVSEEEALQFESEKQKAEAILNPDLFYKKSEEKSSEKEIPISEEPPETEKPLEFTENDTYSFSEWLKLTRAKPIDRKEDSDKKTDQEDVTKFVEQNDSTDEDKERKFDLIDKFIQEQPKIKPTSEVDRENSVAISQQLSAYSKAPDALMTETLARVYLQQKNYKKAIQAYKILILKNPEKSGYFADQIRAIEKITNPEQS